MPSIPLLATTGQDRPLKCCGILSTLGFAGVIAAPFLVHYGHALGGLVDFAIGGSLLLRAVFYALRHTRCPVCGTHWLQYALGEKSLNSWLNWLVTFTRCPECGFTTAAKARAELDSKR